MAKMPSPWEEVLSPAQFTSSHVVQETAPGQHCRKSWKLHDHTLLQCQLSATENKLIKYLQHIKKPTYCVKIIVS